MSKERELLKRCLGKCTYNLWDPDLRKDLEELLAQPEQPEQEPVAWTYEYGDEGRKFFKFTELDLTNMCPSVCNVRALYEAPPKREPLSDERLRDLSNSINATYDFGNISVWQAFYIARLIEKEHDIGGEE